MSREISNTANSLTNTETNVKSINASDSKVPLYGYPVHKSFIGKPQNKSHTYADWELLNFEEAVNAQLNGKDVIWGLIEHNVFNDKLVEFTSGKYQSSGRNTDAKGNRTITNDLIDYTDVVLLDFDGTTSYRDVHPSIIENAFLIHPSASQSSAIAGDVHKFHVLHRLPTQIPNEIIRIYRKLYLEKYGYGAVIDEACIDPRREFYGKNPEFNDANFIKIDLTQVINHGRHFNLVAEASELAINSKTSVDVEFIRDNAEATKGIDETFAILLNDLGIEKFLFSLRPWEFEPKEVSAKSRDNDLLRWECSNPFSDSNNSGRSLVWMVKDDGRIVWLDRSHNTAGNIHEFCVCYDYFQETGNVLQPTSLKEKQTKGKTNKDRDYIDERLTGANWINHVNNLCNHFDIDPIYQTSSKVTLPSDENKETDDDIFRYLKLVTDSSKGETYSYYLYYNFRRYIWQYGLDKRAIRSDCVRPFYAENGGFTIVETVKNSKGEPKKDENGNVEKREREATTKEKGIKCEQTFGEIEDQISIPKLPERDLAYIGFANGNFNLTTKQLEELSPEVYLYSRFSRNYESESFGRIEQFREVLTKYFQCSIKAELFIQYAIAIFNNQGADIKNILFIIGVAGSAKTTVGKIFALAYNDKNVVTSLTGEEINHEFGLEAVTNATQMIIVEELSNLWESLAEKRLKSGWGRDEGGFLSVNRKGLKIMEIQRNFGLIADRQDIPRMPHDDKGFYRRFIFLETPWKTPINSDGVCVPADIYAEMERTILNPQACFEFFLDCIKENADTAIANFKQLRLNPIFKQTAKEVAESNDPFYEFIEATFDVCLGDDPNISETYVLSDVVYSEFQSYFNDGSTKPRGTRKTVAQRIRQSLYSHFPHLKEYETAQNKKKINGAVKTVFVGIKLKPKENSSF